MEKRTKKMITKITIKKKVKQIVACILSVFAFAVALVHPVGSVEAQAATDQSAILAEIKEKTGLEVSESDVYFYYRIGDVYYCIKGYEKAPYSNNFDVTVRVFLSEPKNNNLCYLYFGLYADIADGKQIAFGYQRCLSSDPTKPYGTIGMCTLDYNTDLGSCAAVDTFRIPFASVNDIEVLSTNVESYRLPANKDGEYTEGKFIKTGYSGTLKDNTYDSSKDETGGNSGSSGADYDADLGYLQNIKYTGLKFGNAVNTGDSDFAFKISYGLTTTTGVKLNDNGVGVQWILKIKGGYEKSLYKFQKSDYHSLPTVTSSYYYVTDNKNYFFIESDIYNDLLTKFRTSEVPFYAGLVYTNYIYVRPYRSVNGKNQYGGWSRIDDEGGITKIANGTTSTGDISAEADKENDDFNIESETTSKPEFGSGTDRDDAESNAGPTDSMSDIFKNFGFGEMVDIFNSFKTGLSDVIASFGDFPNLIAKTFPFLPASIVSGICIGFTIAVLLRLLAR